MAGVGVGVGGNNVSMGGRGKGPGLEGGHSQMSHVSLMSHLSHQVGSHLVSSGGGGGGGGGNSHNPLNSHNKPLVLGHGLLEGSGGVIGGGGGVGVGGSTSTASLGLDRGGGGVSGGGGSMTDPLSSASSQIISPAYHLPEGSLDMMNIMNPTLMLNLIVTPLTV